MKARVIATGEIWDVELSHYIGDVAWYITKCHASYSENELEFIDAPEDYWTRLEHQAAIAAMQAQMAPDCLDSPEGVACTAYAYAHALIQKLKESK